MSLRECWTYAGIGHLVSDTAKLPRVSNHHCKSYGESRAYLGVDLHRNVSEVLVETSVALDFGRLEALSNERLGETFGGDRLYSLVQNGVLPLRQNISE